MAVPRKSGLFQRLTGLLFEEVAAQPAPRSLRLAKAEDDETPLASASLDAQPAMSQAIDDSGESLFPHDPAETSRSQVLFNQRLDQLIATGAKGAAGKLQLVNFDEIRGKMGERWPAMAQKARHITEQVIAKRLAASDVSAPIGDGYILLFAELTAEQARLKAMAMAREIRERLLGELDLGDRDWVSAFIGDIAGLHPVSGNDACALTRLSQGLTASGDIVPSHAGLAYTAAEMAIQRRVGEVGVSYRPTFLPAKGVVSLYDARVQRLDDLNRVLSGAAAYPRGDDAVTFEIDRAVLNRAIHDVRHMALEKPALVLVPLHIRSFIAHSSGKLVDPCRELPAGLRRYLAIELVGLGANASTAMLTPAVDAIKPFVRALTARILPSFADLERLARMGFSSVGFDLDDHEIGDLTPSLFVEHLLPLAAKAHARKLQSHLYGIKRRELAKAAADAGFDYINGPIVAADASRPNGLQSMKRNW